MTKTAAAPKQVKQIDNKRVTVSSLAHPRLFALLVVLHFVLCFAGFVPAVYVFSQRSKWFINPVKQSPAWGYENTRNMNVHAILSLNWLCLAWFQYVVTPQFMPKAKALHRVTGYAASLLVVLFVANANYLTIQKGVAGLVLHNFIAIITGALMMWHLIKAMWFVRYQKNIKQHIHHMCALLSWTCFPGMVRSLAILPYQYFLYAENRFEDCDVMNTSGMIFGTLPFCLVGLAWLRWAATGEAFHHGGYIPFYFLMVVDFLVGLLGGTLYTCHPQGALLEQAPGKPWALDNLEKYMSSTA